MALIGATTTTDAASAAGDVIKDGSLATFAADVMEASRQVPVLVDFWAPWCGPCKQLTPVLEKVVTAAKGKVRLVKVNIDENPEIAQQLRVQSVPTVYAFWQGQPLTGFAGAQPESQIKAFVDKLVGAAGGDEGEAGLDEAQALLAEGDAEGAAELFSALLQEDPEKPEVIGGFARALLALGRTADAEQVLDSAPASAANHVEVSGARAAVRLAAEAGDTGDPRSLEAALARDPGAHEARLDLANALFVRGQPDAAVDQLLEIIRRDREWNEEAARKRLLTLFEALGNSHPITLQGRRKLSSLLFS